LTILLLIKVFDSVTGNTTKKLEALYKCFGVFSIESAIVSTNKSKEYDALTYDLAYPYDALHCRNLYKKSLFPLKS
jgi:hypothetical protein